jgi:hypothetical protein
LFSAVAQLGGCASYYLRFSLTQASAGLSGVRILDCLSTNQRLRDELYQGADLFQIADKQAKLLFDLFSPYLPDSFTSEEYSRTLVEVMKVKDELLISKSAYKIAFVPPGTPFTEETMSAIHASGADVYPSELKKLKNPRVKICLW